MREPHADHAAHAAMTSQEAMGHGGHHAGLSMDDMVLDMPQIASWSGVAVHPDLAMVSHRPQGDQLHCSTAIRAARRCLLLDHQPAGDLLLDLDLLRRRLARAAGAHLGHDGPGRCRHWRRLALQRLRRCGGPACRADSRSSDKRRSRSPLEDGGYGPSVVGLARGGSESRWHSAPHAQRASSRRA
jgi:hypothetical protein